ncbi:MAG TPA: ATP-binding protein [Candidatus Latescibacteria bacterium]|nr:ATP-binding protein [Candidatus Latescibacterota bacterium]
MMEDLSLHILDIAENAIAAGATRVSIAVNENEKRDILAFRVTDNGRGMSREEKERALDPFFTTKRKRTGLGLPLLAQTAEVCGGVVVIESVPRKGTRVTARFRFGHIDRPPLSKMAETMMVLFFGHAEVAFRYQHTRNRSRFIYLRSAWSGRATASADIAALRDSLRAGLKRIGAS